MEAFEPDPKLLEALSTLPSRRWSRIVWQHTFGDNPPYKANGRGARCNPPGVEALYASMDRETALAEAEHQMAVQPLRPGARRMLHRVEVHFTSVLDLSDTRTLARLGADAATLQGDDHRPLRAIGGAAAFLGYQALIVASARHGGSNLLIFATNEGAMVRVNIVESEELDGLSGEAGG